MKFIRNNILSIIVAFLIIFLSFMNTSGISKFNILRINNADKIMHMFMYFLFTATISYEHRIKKRKHYILSGLVAFLFGLIIEIFQPVINPARSKEIIDILFNLTGIVLALGIWFFLSKFLKDLQHHIH